jgi:hypothetical protein
MKDNARLILKNISNQDRDGPLRASGSDSVFARWRELRLGKPASDRAKAVTP